MRMRIFAAAADDPGAVAEAIARADPLIAAVSSITPADACAVATKRALRYAVQCWEVPEEGKAIFWKPALLLQGLYRAQFRSRDLQRGAPAGLLRVTFLWNGDPLHVLCAQLSPADDAEWQAAQMGQELDDARGPVLFAIDCAGLAPPSWPALQDAWSAAQVRAVHYGVDVDLARASRAAFGIPVGDAQGAPAVDDAPCRMRLLLSDHFTIARSTMAYDAPPPARCSAVFADVRLPSDAPPERTTMERSTFMVDRGNAAAVDDKRRPLQDNVRA